jgi:hypothetical protein
MTLYQVAEEIARRLASIFLKGKDGRRPVNGGEARFHSDPLWRDYIPFYEYFHGDNGAGLGASHQTGWTGVIAKIMHLFATTSAEQVLELEKTAAVAGARAPAATTGATKPVAAEARDAKRVSRGAAP